MNINIILNNNMYIIIIIKKHLGSGSDRHARKHPVMVARLTDQMT